jgi:aminopeptidase N
MKTSIFLLILFVFLSMNAHAQMPAPDALAPGVSQELARWRAAHYSDVRYKLSLTLEKMSPVLKGTMEIRVKLGPQAASPATAATAGEIPPIILDWRKIGGHEKDSTVTNITLNEIPLFNGDQQPVGIRPSPAFKYHESNDHLILPDAVKVGEIVIQLDFTSPILTSGSAITRYVDKEDGSEYLYSLFVPSDASTAFPVFDQPDLKARFQLSIRVPAGWHAISNTDTAVILQGGLVPTNIACPPKASCPPGPILRPDEYSFNETKPISTYVFAFAAGPFEEFTRISREDVEALPISHGDPVQNAAKEERLKDRRSPLTHFYVRKSQASKFEPHSKDVFTLNSEAVKYFEEYFNFKYPFPKYDLVLIPEFPFGGMEHAGATFLRESSVIFPQEPTKNDLVNRATLIFHETAHQWFGDTVTMRWFDDLWLKEGFATFMGYKALEKIMPEMNAWKVFYERVKQGAYQTDSTKGTTPIYQEIKNLSAAKSAYGNIVYNKAPAFLRQAEFYLGEDKFQTAVRAFLKKHEYANAGWEDLVNEFSAASQQNMSAWANVWVKQSGLPTFRLCIGDYSRSAKYTGHPGEINMLFSQTGFPCYPPTNRSSSAPIWPEALQFYYILADAKSRTEKVVLAKNDREIEQIWGYSFGARESNQAKKELAAPKFVHTNYQDYGYGIFLLDDKSRDYVLKNIQNEKDPFLRSMMWGALWDSVREGELDPREYVELVVKVVGSSAFRRPVGDSESAKGNALPAKAGTPNDGTPNDDESTVALLLSRVGTAMNYYIDPRVASGTLAAPVENLLIERMQNAPTLGQRITFYRAFLNIASSENARNVLKKMLTAETPRRGENTGGTATVMERANNNATAAAVPLKTKDKFDIVTRLLILNDPDAPKLLTELEKTETSDDAKR